MRKVFHKFVALSFAPCVETLFQQAPLNQMYFSVPYDESYELAYADYKKQLGDGTVSDDTLFILEDSILQNTELNLYLGTLDGFVVGSKNEIEGIPEYVRNSV